MRGKILGIGLSKTGTTSLAEALRILGYTVNDADVGLKHIDQADASTDMPVAHRFKELDRRYPGSKFIYTIRDRSDWLRSCQIQWLRHSYPPKNADHVAMLIDIFGSVEFDEQVFADGYDRHDRQVRSYFSGRQDDLLIVDLCAYRRWDGLCAFLRKPVPSVPFPHANISASGWRVVLLRKGVDRRLMFDHVGTVRAALRSLKRWGRRHGLWPQRTSS